MATVLMLLPESDYDPTESALPWAALREAGHHVSFATPAGRPAFADPRLVDVGFGLLTPVLMTRTEALDAYRAMRADPAFTAPLSYADVRVQDFDALLVPGGHAQGMKTLLESATAQAIVVECFALDRPVAAVCHGVLLLARSKLPATGKSVLHGRKTTALTRSLELSAWGMTCLWLGDYYRTYPVTVEDEVKDALKDSADFLAGPLLPKRDSARTWQRGFVVRDGNYLSARWPGDCHRFAREFALMLQESPAAKAA